MKSILYFIFGASIILTSCKSEVKTVPDQRSTETQNDNSRNGAPTFTMVDNSKSSIKVAVADTIEVSSIEDIVANANHNTALRLKKGNYKLNEHLVYYISKDRKEIINKQEVSSRSVGGQVFVSGMTNFSILGSGSKILSNNPKAVPLFILNAEQGEIKDLYLGHNITKNNASKVPSLYVTGANKVNFINCTLGNNSKTGLKIQNSKFLTFTDCNILNAKEKIIEVIKGKSIKYVNSSFSNNGCARGCFDFLGVENSVEFNNVIIKGNQSKGKIKGTKQIITGPSHNIRFRDSKFQNNKNFEQLGIDEFNLTECEIQKF